MIYPSDATISVGLGRGRPLYTLNDIRWNAYFPLYIYIYICICVCVRACVCACVCVCVCVFRRWAILQYCHHQKHAVLWQKLWCGFQEHFTLNIVFNMDIDNPVRNFVRRTPIALIISQTVYHGTYVIKLVFWYAGYIEIIIVGKGNWIVKI